MISRLALLGFKVKKEKSEKLEKKEFKETLAMWKNFNLKSAASLRV